MSNSSNGAVQNQEIILFALTAKNLGKRLLSVRRLTRCRNIVRDGVRPPVVLRRRAGGVIRFIETILIRIDILRNVRALAAPQNAPQQSPARRILNRV
jgi:hypothetical protein